MAYRDIDCPNCGRHRVEDDGVCEKCEWDVDGNDWARVTRPERYEEPPYSGLELRDPTAEKRPMGL